MAAFPTSRRRSDGALLGYAYAGPYRTRPAYRFTVEDSIYVAPQAQRRGVGRALLDAPDRGVGSAAASARCSR